MPAVQSARPALERNLRLYPWFKFASASSSEAVLNNADLSVIFWGATRSSVLQPFSRWASLPAAQGFEICRKSAHVCGDTHSYSSGPYDQSFADRMDRTIRPAAF